MKVFWIVTLVLLGNPLYSQDHYTPQKNAEKCFKKGNEAFEKRAFYEAEKWYLKAKKIDVAYPKPYVALQKLYQYLGDKYKIEKLQNEYLTNVSQNFFDSHLIHLIARRFFEKGDYLKTQNLLQTIKKPDSLLVASAQFAIQQLEKTNEKLVIRRLPNTINRFQFQYFPNITVSGDKLFFTARLSIYDDENIVWSKKNKDGWTHAESVSPQINTHENEGASTISADGKVMVLTSCGGRESYGNCDLYVTQKTGSNWTIPKNMGENINSIYWDSQPALSSDGTELYFVSNRKGGIGGKDIWKSEFVNNEWTKAQNLGEIVNTTKDEITPYIFFDKKNLFFSTNGRIGMGGFDLHHSVWDSIWKKPINLGYPINTHNDEISLIIENTGKTGFLAKEIVKNQKIDSSYLVEMEIGKYINLEPVNFYLGKILDKSNGKPISAHIEIVNLRNQVNVYSTQSDSVNGEFHLTLLKKGKYGAFVEKEGYLFEDITFEKEKTNEDTTFIYLQPLKKGAKIILNNVYFDFDSDTLSDWSKVELAKIINLLKENKHLSVAILGHTDSHGTLDYNKILSENRAKRVYEYLVNHDIEKNRLSFKGLADRYPIENKTRSKLNRRIELEIVK